MLTLNQQTEFKYPINSIKIIFALFYSIQSFYYNGSLTQKCLALFYPIQPQSFSHDKTHLVQQSNIYSIRANRDLALPEKNLIHFL